MKTFTKLSLALAAVGALALSAPSFAGWHDGWGHRGGGYWCQNYDGDCYRHQGYRDDYGPRHWNGPRHFNDDRGWRGHRGWDGDRPWRGHRGAMSMWGGHRYDHGYCLRHDAPMADCIGSKAYEQFKGEFDQLQQLREQTFVKKQVLDALVNTGENNAQRVEAAANDFVQARDNYRSDRAALDQKIEQFYDAQ